MRRLLVLLLLIGCSKGPRETNCPSGTVRAGSLCVRPDEDAGADPDSGDIPEKDAGTDGGGPIDAGEDAATISTALLDFGGVLIGTTETRSFTIENRTAMPVVVSVGTIAGSGEVTVRNSPGTVTMEPNDAITVEVDFAPTAAVPLSAVLPVSLCEEGCTVDVQISGTGLVEQISCAPAPLDFGFVNPNACATRDVTCTNVSSQRATIFDAVLAANSSPALALTASSSTPVDLAGGDALILSVEYCPTGFTNDSGTIALTIDHPDPRYTTKAIQISGTGGGPDIRCTERVSFGIAGVGQTITRNATCTNEGNVPLLISSAMFAAGTTGDLTASLSANPPVSLAVGESLDITMTFAPSAPGSHNTTFEVASNDTDTPRASIEVTAEALAAGGCTVELSPAALAFGAVAPGASSEATANVRNTGTGACAINVLGLSAQSAPEFALVNGPQSMNLGPGAIFPVRVRFTPSSETSFTGAVELTTTDPANAMPTIALSGDGLSPFGSIRALPSAIDFGQVQAGCTNAATQVLVLHNSGADAMVDVTLETGTPSEFGLTGAMPNPVAIPAGGTADFTISFQPGAAGTFSGRVQISIVGGPTIFVPIDGEGAPAANTTVTFPAQPAAQLDVLVVIDDSCSMSEEQQQLAVAAPILIARGDAAGVEYHIGVTTTDGSPGISGTLRGTPSVVTWTSPTRAQDLAANINRGVNGSAFEEGLRTGTEAVTNSALLSGPNAGFLRPNANLVLIVLSDEDDQSPGDVATYLDRLTTQRPVGAPGTPQIYTITGGLAGCPTASEAPRYVQAANDSGGFDRSICAPDYSPIITEIADAAFAPRRARFGLGSAPVPGSIAVRVDGTAVPATAWGVDYVTNEVVFLPGNEPRLSQTVEIDFTGLCVPATCGNATMNSGEQCDDGNMINTDACLDTCLLAFCGDTFVQSTGEQCDDGNTISGDGCNAQCTIEGCGNGIVEPPEECDDGAGNSNTTPNACRTNCLAPFCGDGVIDTGEQCDDANAIDTDACIACQNARCGDGFVHQGVEECDDANMIDTDDCANDCTSSLVNFLVTTVSQPLTPAAGTPLTIGDEDIIPVAIGFPFTYLGTPVTNVNVGDNGFIMFDPAPAFGAFYTNAAIPNSADPNAIIAWWWDDHHPGRALTPAPQVRTAISGTAPNRVRTITFVDVPRYPSAETGRINAEIRLYETTNVIEVHYGTITDPANDTEWSASVGWESSATVRGAAVLPCTPNCREADWPTNTIHRYTPQ